MQLAIAIATTPARNEAFEAEWLGLSASCTRRPVLGDTYASRPAAARQPLEGWNFVEATGRAAVAETIATSHLLMAEVDNARRDDYNPRLPGKRAKGERELARLVWGPWLHGGCSSTG